ncbi:helix-turn-helix transcriptional regulator [Streptomyces sp. NPDC023838]|uniref:helix-turn-helix domain-containing protein n=1 Tax=Streptomyces sp. NPDC023838 TaxID=3154325 RepID=UPI00340CAFB5
MATAESEDFAALLRELKDRSGRSYGVLAGKLHVSTSTLHRYCNGDAVPNEYAPVDRVARLCGATRDESVELHRRWILADEARRRARGGTAAAAATAAAAPEPVAEAEPEPKPEAKPEAPSEAPASEPASAPDPGPGEPPLVGMVGDVAPRRTPRMTRRTRLGLIAAGVVVALGVPAVAVASLGGGSGDDQSAGSETVADARASGETGPKTAPAKSPSPSPDASSPSPAGSGSGSPSARTPSSPAPRRHAPPAADPLAVGVSSYQWDGPCGKFYLLDQKPGSVPRPPAPEESRPWAQLLGGVDGGHLTLQLTATGKTAESVVINAVHVRVVDRGAPLDWTAYSMGSGCGGSVTPGFFDIDLDAAQPRTKPVGGAQGEVKVPAKDFPYKVSTTDPQVLNLDVHTDAHDVTWYLEIDWSSGDRSGKIPVYDNGKPFHSSAVKGRPAYEYRLDTNVWERLTT